MKLSREQLENFLFHQRPFVVKIDGIWRAVMGVYIPPIKDPLNIKCILNGKEVVIMANNYIDYEGLTPREVDGEIIRLNISTLPQRPPRVVPPAPRVRRNTYFANQNTGIITPLNAFEPLTPHVPALVGTRGDNQLGGDRIDNTNE